jgi:hypothetical protein
MATESQPAGSVKGGVPLESPAGQERDVPDVGGLIGDGVPLASSRRQRDVGTYVVARSTHAQAFNDYCLNLTPGAIPIDLITGKAEHLYAICSLGEHEDTHEERTIDAALTDVFVELDIH